MPVFNEFDNNYNFDKMLSAHQIIKKNHYESILNINSLTLLILNLYS